MVPFTTARALTFVSGEEGLAIKETCLDLAMLRRLATHTDIIAVAISGARLAGEQTARLLADMLSEWPLDRPLPDACTAALAPPVDEELLLCHAVRGEFRMIRKHIAIMNELADRQGDWLDRVQGAMLWDDESTVALAAEQLPTELNDAAHRIELSPDGRMLRAPLTWTPRGEWAEAPLPAALTP